MYDPELGIFYAVDPQHQFDSPYMAMAGNPIIYVDPDGEFANAWDAMRRLFGAPKFDNYTKRTQKDLTNYYIRQQAIMASVILSAGTGAASGIIGGALTGGVTSGVVYTGTALATGSFDKQYFWKAVAFGAISGGIGGGIGSIGGEAANNIGLNIIKSSASNIAGNVILGNDITTGTIVGGVASGLLGSLIPQFEGVKGNGFLNAVAEIGYESLRGGALGSFGGGVTALIDKKNFGRGVAYGALNGAIGGATIATFNLLLLGPVVNKNLSSNELNRIASKVGLEVNELPVFRRGHFKEAGITIGKTSSHGVMKNPFEEDKSYIRPNLEKLLRVNWIAGLGHEAVHWSQILSDGFGKFYLRQLIDYVTGHRHDGYYEAPAYKVQSRMLFNNHNYDE